MVDDGGIIIKEEVFEEAYIPSRMLHREGQIREVARCLEPVVEGRRALNLFLYGPPGTGKTTLVKYMFDDLSSRSMKFKPIYINCWERNSKHAVASALLSSVDPLAPLKRTPAELLEDFLGSVERKEYNVVVCLDEVDRMEDKDMLYDLSRAGLGLVLVSNDPYALVDLDTRLQSSLFLNFVEFPKYRPDELVDILKDRAEIGLRPGAIEPHLLRVIAVSAEGDARVAIATLRNAAKLAESRGASKIEKDDVMQSVKAARKLKVQQILSTLNEEMRLLYSIVEEHGEISSAELYQIYRERSKKPVAERTYRNYMDRLVELKLVKAEGDVRWRRYKVV